MQFVYDDGGREAAGYKGKTGDCGVMAAAIALSRNYKEVYLDLFDLSKGFHSTSRKRAVKKANQRKVGASPRGGIWREVLGPYVTAYGATWVPLAFIGSKPVRVKDVAERWPDKKLIMSLARHYSAMAYGINRDTWAQHPEKRVYGVWVMPQDGGKL